MPSLQSSTHCRRASQLPMGRRDRIRVGRFWSYSIFTASHSTPAGTAQQLLRRCLRFRARLARALLLERHVFGTPNGVPQRLLCLLLGAHLRPVRALRLVTQKPRIQALGRHPRRAGAPDRSEDPTRSRQTRLLQCLAQCTVVNYFILLYYVCNNVISRANSCQIVVVLCMLLR